jgi:hypothetical protein
MYSSISYFVFYKQDYNIFLTQIPKEMLPFALKLVKGMRSTSSISMYCAGILEQYMEARNRVGVGLSHRPARLQYIGCRAGTATRFLAPKDCSKIPALLLFNAVNPLCGYR